MDPKHLIEKPNTIIFFYMDGCPYCIKTEPYWNELKKKYESKERIPMAQSKGENAVIQE